LWLLLAAWVALGHAARAADDRDGSGVVVLEPAGRVVTPLLAAPPAPTDKVPTCSPRPPVAVPVDPSADLSMWYPTNPSIQSATRGPRTVGSPEFQRWRRTLLPVGAGGIPANSVSTVDEPSLASTQDVVFLSGNWYAAVSRDAGLTWQHVDPFTLFPAPPATQSGTFCCDQVVHYDVAHGVLVWELQYLANNAGNIQRIAVARNLHAQLETGAIAWTIYDWRPSDFGITAAGIWMDFPDLATTNGYLFQTTNTYTAAPANAYYTSIIWRVPWTDLTAAGNLSFSYMRTASRGWRMVQGATDAMHWASHETTAKLRVWQWLDAQDTSGIVQGDVRHNGYATDGFTLPASPDGTNYAFRGDNRILGAYVVPQGNVKFLGFLWHVGRGGAYVYPYTRFVGASTDTINVNGESDATLQFSIWNDNYAVMYPTAMPNDRGDVAVMVTIGGGASHPESHAIIAAGNDWSTPTVTLNFLAESTNGPPANTRWGDYFTLRKSWYSGQTWVGGTYIQTGAAAGQGRPVFVWFGQNADAPPADLQPTSVGTFDLFPVTGQPLPVNAVVENIGVTTSAACTLEFRLSTDLTLTIDDPLLGSVTVPALTNGESVLLQDSPVVPANLPPGTYYLGAMVRPAAVDGFGPNDTIISAIPLGTGTPTSNPIPGKATLIKPAKLFKFVAKGTFPLPNPLTDNPTTEGGTLSFVGTTGGQTYGLPAACWKGLGPGGDGSKGFKCKDAICRSVVVKEKVIKGTCKPDTGTFRLPESGDVDIVLTIGTGMRYCARCGGTVAGNPDDVFKRQDCAAPAACP
jgi:hypothetical protein